MVNSLEEKIKKSELENRKLNNLKNLLLPLLMNGQVRISNTSIE